MLPLPLFSGRQDPGTVLDMKSVCTLCRRGRYLLVPEIEPRLTVLPVCCIIAVLTKQDGLKKPRMFFEEDSRSLSQESPVLGIPNIVPRNCVLIIQTDSQTGSHKYSFYGLRVKECRFLQRTTSCKNRSHLQVFHCVCMCVFCAVIQTI